MRELAGLLEPVPRGPALPLALGITRVWIRGLARRHQWGWKSDGSGGTCSPRKGPAAQQAPQVTALI